MIILDLEIFNLPRSMHKSKSHMSHERLQKWPTTRKVVILIESYLLSHVRFPPFELSLLVKNAIKKKNKRDHKDGW